MGPGSSSWHPGVDRSSRSLARWRGSTSDRGVRGESRRRRPRETDQPPYPTVASVPWRALCRVSSRDPLTTMVVAIRQPRALDATAGCASTALELASITSDLTGSIQRSPPSRGTNKAGSPRHPLDSRKCGSKRSMLRDWHPLSAPTGCPRSNKSPRVPGLLWPGVRSSTSTRPRPGEGSQRCSCRSWPTNAGWELTPDGL